MCEIEAVVGLEDNIERGESGVDVIGAHMEEKVGDRSKCKKGEVRKQCVKVKLRRKETKMKNRIQVGDHHTRNDKIPYFLHNL